MEVVDVHHAMIFERFETKYVITKHDYEQLKKHIRNYLRLDDYGKTQICNLYYDTKDYRIIRRSLEGPVYKEKLRLRSYGPVAADDAVFLELKKKFEKIVYKRRIGMPLQQATEFIEKQIRTDDSQIAHEIEYFKNFYQDLIPVTYIAYEREAYCGRKDEGLRITFDQNLVYRLHDLHLDREVYGEPLLDEDQMLMEIKSPAGIPLWLLKILNELHIYKTSFSKYGKVYEAMMDDESRGNYDVG